MITTTTKNLGNNNGKKLWVKLFVIAFGLIFLSLIFGACAEIPGQDPPCVGARRDEPGCQPDLPPIRDQGSGGPWYLEWGFTIIKSLLSEAAVNAVKISIVLFWLIYTQAGSTDFASCESGLSANSPTCITVAAAEPIRAISFVLIGIIIYWKFFRAYFLGAVIENFREGGIDFILKAIILAVCIYFQNVLITAFFGFSNLIFNTIMGGPDTFRQITENILGSNNSGVGSVAKIENVGILLFTTVICFFIAIVFIGLALVFFIRVILIYIHFVLAALAWTAGLTDEFGGWFARWVNGIQAMLIAPLPVAACLALIKGYGQALPNAHDKPAEFILQMIFIGSFLLVGTILMFTISNGAGAGIAGATVGGLKRLAGASAGALPRFNGRSAPGTLPVPPGARSSTSQPGGGGAGSEGNGNAPKSATSNPTAPGIGTSGRIPGLETGAAAAKLPPGDERPKALTGAVVPAALGYGFSSDQAQFARTFRGLAEALYTLQQPKPSAALFLPPAQPTGSASIPAASSSTMPTGSSTSGSYIAPTPGATMTTGQDDFDLFSTSGTTSSASPAPGEMATADPKIMIVPVATPTPNGSPTSSSRERERVVNSSVSTSSSSSATQPATTYYSPAASPARSEVVTVEPPRRPVFANPQPVRLSASVSIPSPFVGTDTEADRTSPTSTATRRAQV
jgi:hypothetical protein